MLTRELMMEDVDFLHEIPTCLYVWLFFFYEDAGVFYPRRFKRKPLLTHHLNRISVIPLAGFNVIR